MTEFHTLPIKDYLAKDYRLTTAEILYYLPDHPRLLQSFIWQDLDIAPQFPILGKFLAFWEKEIEGKLHSVKVANTKLLVPAQFNFCKAEWKLH